MTNDPGEFLWLHEVLSPRTELIVILVLLACIIMLILLCKVLLKIRSTDIKVSHEQQELMRMGEVLDVMQDRIGLSHQKMTALRIIRDPGRSRCNQNEADDFRERFAR